MRAGLSSARVMRELRCAIGSPKMGRCASAAKLDGADYRSASKSDVGSGRGNLVSPESKPAMSLGRVMVNVAPWLGSDSIVILPECSSTIFLVTAKPNPVPR